MKIHTIHFDGSMEELGIEVGTLFADEFHKAQSSLQRHALSVPEFYRPYMDGVSAATDIPVADLGGIMMGARQEPSGRLWCFKGHTLAARYRFQPADHLQFFYGYVDGKRFGYLSLFPHPPGTLAGINRAGIAWARRVPKQYSILSAESPYTVGELVTVDNNRWHRVAAMDLRDITLAAAVPHRLVTSQPNFEPVAQPTVEVRARELFDDAEDDLDLLLFIECQTRHVTLRRGGGGEMTYDILAD